MSWRPTQSPRRRARAGKVNVPLLVVGLLIALPLIWLLVASFGRNPRAVPSVLVDRPAPGFTLETLEGETLSLSDLHGKPVVINFWSTWCQPCKIEHPILLRAAQAYEGDVVFLGALYSDEPSKARAYLKRAGTAYPHLVDPGGRVAIDYGVAGVPETYFIDAEGVITHKQVGPVNWPMLTTMLGEP